MSTITKDQEQYIEHEVKIRLHDEKFQIIERDFDDVKSSMRHLDSKFDTQFKWIIGMFVSSIIIPVVLHFIKVV
jgi:hypothetical protein